MEDAPPPKHHAVLARLCDELRGDNPGRNFGRLLRVAEIGVASGNLSESLLRIPFVSLVMVDHWIPRRPERDANAAMIQAKERTQFAAEDGRREIIVASSCRAATIFPPQWFDLVFIDACHRYESVREDIAAWVSKVRPGGILCGHDYFSPRNEKGQWGVKRAVDEWAAESGIAVEFAETVWLARMPG